MKKISAAALFTFILLASCTPKASTAGPIGPAVCSAEQKAQGKNKIENSSGRCNKQPDPNTHTTVQRVGIMNSMAPKAKLTDEQHQWVYDYIVSVKK
jgi:hypothetical protein